MELPNDDGDRGQLARTVLATALTVVAIRSLLRGKRVRGMLAGVGALALGYTATDESAELGETIGIDALGESEDAELTCAICGDPIRPGQRRGPNEDEEIAHEACMEAAD